MAQGNHWDSAPAMIRTKQQPDTYVENLFGMHKPVCRFPASVDHQTLVFALSQWYLQPPRNVNDCCINVEGHTNKGSWLISDDDISLLTKQNKSSRAVASSGALQLLGQRSETARSRGKPWFSSLIFKIQALEGQTIPKPPTSKETKFISKSGRKLDLFVEMNVWGTGICSPSSSSSPSPTSPPPLNLRTR